MTKKVPKQPNNPKPKDQKYCFEPNNQCNLHDDTKAKDQVFLESHQAMMNMLAKLNQRKQLYWNCTGESGRGVTYTPRGQKTHRAVTQIARLACITINIVFCY